MMGKRLFLSLLALLSVSFVWADGKVQKFFNLTANEVKIDSLLPSFGYSMPLGKAWADSTYTVSIEYAEFLDMSDADVERYKKITDKLLPEIPEVHSRVVVERKRGHLEMSFVPLVMRDGRYKKLVSFMIEVKSKPKSRAARAARAAADESSADRYAANSVLAEGRWAKIRVPQTGIYQITDALIRRAGFSNLSKVKVYGYGGALQNEKLDGDYLIEYDDLKEVPTCTVDGKKLFHATGTVTWSSNTATRRTRNPYSDYGYYFITENDNEPLTVDSTAFVDSFYPSADDYHSLHEIDNYAWYHGGRNLFEDSPINAGSSKTYTISPASGQAGAGRISVGVTAGRAITFQIAVNGETKGTYSMSFGDYDSGKETEVTYDIADLGATNTVTISTTSGGPARLDYISVYQNIPRARPTLHNTSFSLPEYVYNITNQNHHADESVDMVIIVPTSGKLTAQAQRLKDFHEQHDGMTVRIVPADELFNEFSSGTPDANAYRRYLKMMYDRAETEAEMPKHLLLFGDCLWDNRMNTSAGSGLNADDFLLCYESENSFNAISCYVDDGFFTLLDDGEGGSSHLVDKQDVSVGRFPVRTEAEAKIMVDKTISYMENENAGSWQNIIVVMGDDGNNNQHMKDANELASEVIEKINPAIQVKRVMWDAYVRESSATGNTYPEAAKLIKQQQESGALIMDYSGHGRADQISHERVLTNADFAEFTNKNLPLWITASCDIMPFDSQLDNIGESAVLNQNGGAVAFFGTARTVYISQNREINQAFMRYLLTPVDGKYVSIGEAQRLAKNYLIDDNKDTEQNKLHYAILGDPALVLNIPRQAVVIDSIDGVELATAQEMPALKAGSVVTVKGHVEANDGVDTSFNGVVSALVRDAEKLVVCKLNNTDRDEGSSTKYEYYDRDKTLYNGSDSIRAGKFSFTFAVPKDMDYSNKSGIINVFATNSLTHEGLNGYTEDFTVGGTGSLENDSIGPSIYCYLNSPSFTNGASVNTTPYFVAEISDKDGINTTGNGIGHDLVLTIDGDASKTYVLNSNFAYDFGSYTKGSTYYNIPELEPGTHTLRFRAWDIKNNSSTAELTFNVVKGLKPDYLSVDCSSNPATTSTTFIVNHDRAGSNLNVEIEVLDISGRPLWKHSERGAASVGAYTVDWDLLGSNGERLQTGVYIYRVTVSCDGSGSVTKAKKLVIISN